MGRRRPINCAGDTVMGSAMPRKSMLIGNLSSVGAHLPDGGSLSNIGWGWLSCNPYEDFEINGYRLPIDGGC